MLPRREQALPTLSKLCCRIGPGLFVLFTLFVLRDMIFLRACLASPRLCACLRPCPCPASVPKHIETKKPLGLCHFICLVGLFFFNVLSEPLPLSLYRSARLPDKASTKEPLGVLLTSPFRPGSCCARFGDPFVGTLRVAIALDACLSCDCFGVEHTGSTEHLLCPAGSHAQQDLVGHSHLHDGGYYDC